MACDSVDEGSGSFPQAAILIVDDSPANLLALEALLEPLGHEIVRAGSGDEALHQILRRDFALILMDVMMPGLDGYQTVALIKKRDKSKDVPVIFVSAIATEAEYIDRAYSYGAVDFLAKPFDPDMLRAKVSVLVALHQQAARIAVQRDMLEKERQHVISARTAQEVAESASRVKDECMAMVTHELKGPLQTILSCAQLLETGRLDAAQTREVAITIEQSAHVQAQLLEELLDASRLLRGKLSLEKQRVAPDSIVQAALDAVRSDAQAKGIHLIHRLDPLVGTTDADPRRLQQVVWNLLCNAIKFTPEGGRVEVGWSRVANGIQLVVADSGCGIPTYDLERVFEPFWQGTEARTQGLGLGLSIVRHLVELHGGTVRATSAGEGRGSTFTVRLPQRPAASRRDAPSPPRASADRSTTRSF